LKTTNVPYLRDCPNWSDDILPQHVVMFRALLASVQQKILATAAQRLVDVEDVFDWHKALFEKFVPIPCYAGRFRGDDHKCLRQNVSIGDVQGLDWQFVTSETQRLFRLVRHDLHDLELNWQAISPRDRALRLAVLAANLVCGFIRIHPFINGNGRSSRLLWRWALHRFGVPAQVREHPRPGPPYPDVMAAAMRGDARPCVRLVLEHLALHRPDVR